MPARSIYEKGVLVVVNDEVVDQWEVPERKASKKRPVAFVAVGFALLVVLGLAAQREIKQNEEGQRIACPAGTVYFAPTNDCRQLPTKEIRVPVKTTCKPEYLYFELTNRCYKIYDGANGNFSRADQICDEDETELVSIFDAREGQENVIVQTWPQESDPDYTEWISFTIPQRGGKIHIEIIEPMRPSVGVEVNRFFCAHGELPEFSHSGQKLAEEAETRVFFSAYGLRKGEQAWRVVEVTTASYAESLPELREGSEKKEENLKRKKLVVKGRKTTTTTTEAPAEEDESSSEEDTVETTVVPEQPREPLTESTAPAPTTKESHFVTDPLTTTQRSTTRKKLDWSKLFEDIETTTVKNGFEWAKMVELWNESGGRGVELKDKVFKAAESFAQQFWPK